MTSLDIIRNASRKQLRDRDWLEDAIAKLGLGERPVEIPPRLKSGGKGLHIWQYPNQLAPYLIYMAYRKIGVYAEIGVRHGGTFMLTVEYLNRFKRLSKAIAIDIVIRPEMRAYAEENDIVQLIESKSTSDEASEAIAELKPDLVMIDADHTEEACRADYEVVKPHAKWIAIHDIVEWTCPGVKPVWDSVTGEKVEFVDQYPGVTVSTYGIGLVRNDNA